MKLHWPIWLGLALITAIWMVVVGSTPSGDRLISDKATVYLVLYAIPASIGLVGIGLVRARRGRARLPGAALTVAGLLLIAVPVGIVSYAASVVWKYRETLASVVDQTHSCEAIAARLNTLDPRKDVTSMQAARAISNKYLDKHPGQKTLTWRIDLTIYQTYMAALMPAPTRMDIYCRTQYLGHGLWMKDMAVTRFDRPLDRLADNELALLLDMAHNPRRYRDKPTP